MNAYSCSYKCEYIQSSDTFAARALILAVRSIVPARGIPSKPPMPCHFLLLRVALSDLRVLTSSVSSWKTNGMGAICIIFQIEAVEARSATVPVCLKSAKAL